MICIYIYIYIHMRNICIRDICIRDIYILGIYVLGIYGIYIYMCVWDYIDCFFFLKNGIYDIYGIHIYIYICAYIYNYIYIYILGTSMPASQRVNAPSAVESK